MASGLVFATVGTTKFDSLVFNITRENSLKALRRKGFTKLNIQIGRGTKLPDVENGAKTGVKITFYRYKDSIEEDIAEADLVVSHAGAGSCLEVLAKGKPLLVVINRDLMDNHQSELAEQLSKDGYVFASDTSNLAETIEGMDLRLLKKFPKADPQLFPRFLNQFMGFDQNQNPGIKKVQ